MQIVDIAPLIAAAAFLAFALYILNRDASFSGAGWILPAVLSFLFLIWSLSAVFTEGPMGFWIEHTRNLWGVQIWFDLLLAVGIGWFLIVPQAKTLGMRVPLWLALIVLTGCIGFTAMLARFLYLRDQQAASSLQQN